LIKDCPNCGKQMILEGNGKISWWRCPDEMFCKNVYTEETLAEKHEELRREYGAVIPYPSDIKNITGDKLEDLPTDLIEGIVRKGDKLTIVAPSKANKTHMLIQLAISVSTGGYFMDRACEQSNVLFIDTELQKNSHAHRVDKIKNALKCGLDDGAYDLLPLRGVSVTVESIADFIIRCSEKKTDGYGLIILDPLYRFLAERDENSATAMASLFCELERIAQSTGAVIAYSHHFAKGDATVKEAIDRPSGSGVVGRDADAMLVFTRHEEEGSFTVNTILRDHPPVDPFVVTVDYPLVHVDPELDPEDLRHPKKNLVKQITPDNVMSYLTDFLQTREEIEYKIREDTGRGKNAVRKAFHDAIELMHVEGTHPGKKYRRKFND